MAMEGWVRERSTNRKGGMYSMENILGDFLSSMSEIEIVLPYFSNLNYYISAIIYGIFTMCVPKC